MEEASISLDPDQVYLLKGSKNIEPDEVNYRDLMKYFKLESHFTKMRKAELPQTFHHLLRGLRESAQLQETTGELLGLLHGVPFDRPIERFPETLLQSALALPPASKPGPVFHPIKATSSSTKSNGLIHAPPLTAKEKAQLEDKLKASGGGGGGGGSASSSGLVAAATGKSKDDLNRKEKKDKKRKKREKEEAGILQTVLAPLVTELRNVTWHDWIVNGKAGNPFIQKITRDNCKRLGVPNYFDFVKEPMDLTRMKEKVDKNEYSKLDQFRHDVRLIVANAKTFNRIGEPVHRMASELEQLFELKLKPYQKTYEDLLNERKKRKKEKKKKKDKKKDKAV